MRNRWAFVVVVGVVLGGCAGYCVTDLSTGQEGYVVYEPWPYLLQSEFPAGGDAKGWKFELVYLPNRARPYRVRSWAGLSKADFEFTFQNGWMFTGLKDKSDNTAVLDALMALAKPLVDPMAKLPEGARPSPRLYRLEFDSCGMVCGLTPVESNEQIQKCGPCPK